MYTFRVGSALLVLALLPACGDSGTDSVSASGSDTSTGTNPSSSGESPTSSGETATASEAGSDSESSTVPTTTDDPSTGTTSGTSSTGETSTTASTDTGVLEFCSPPDVPVGDVPANEACDIPLQMGTFNPVVEWKYGQSSFCGPAVVGQTIDSNQSGSIDAADLPVVYLYEFGSVVALRGDGSGVAWTSAGNFGQDGGFALGDLDGDGWSELITANASTVCALDARDGTMKWCTPGLEASLDAIGYSYPAIADMDGDGSAEVIVGNTILDSAGGVIATGAQGKGATPWFNDANAPFGVISAVVDLDGDGIQEVVTGNAAYDLDGNTLWQNGEQDGFVAVADFDLDGEGEIVKTSGVRVVGMESDGTHVWGPIEFVGNLGVPAIDDLDGDGVPEIVVGAQDKLVAMEWGGQEMWSAPITDFSGAAGPVLFDFEKDGYPEVLYADEAAILFFSGLDGALKYQSAEHASYTIFETPIVADVDGDDEVEIVLGHCQGDGQIGAITVYGDADHTWPPGRKIWNQHTYHITNVGDLGSVPASYQSNWAGGNTFNSFRSADVGQLPGEYHDLQAEILGVCEDECAGGKFYMAARVRNAGTLEAPAGLPVVVRAGVGGPIVATLDTTEPVPPGKTGEVLFFALDAADLADTQPVVIVDDTGLGEGELFECDELNNSAVWPNSVCPVG
ncbi:VCBS repeat-containing protein [Nannocystis sp. SCPEA4]|uniref:FG-GAP repeat domain-containing protein n=1 Tax=Nannocystis sp. SCPEA4 TaxID=2996787 RepID=UPI00227110D4|nr:VCBS repeat-containing protein [Nannocystis sp. SCPEA4]MCY1054905.1 VCBS repeat-containing protein [Nannocystis sp. SCPEA4]